MYQFIKTALCLALFVLLHWLMGYAAVFAALVHGSQTGHLIWSIGWTPFHILTLPSAAWPLAATVSLGYSLLVVGTVMLLWRFTADN